MDGLDALQALNEKQRERARGFAEQWYRNIETELSTLALLCDDEVMRTQILKFRGDVREFLGEART